MPAKRQTFPRFGFISAMSVGICDSGSQLRRAARQRGSKAATARPRKMAVVRGAAEFQSEPPEEVFWASDQVSRIARINGVSGVSGKKHGLRLARPPVQKSEMAKDPRC